MQFVKVAEFANLRCLPPPSPQKMSKHAFIIKIIIIIIIIIIKEIIFRMTKKIWSWKIYLRRESGTKKSISNPLLVWWKFQARVFNTWINSCLPRGTRSRYIRGMFHSFIHSPTRDHRTHRINKHWTFQSWTKKILNDKVSGSIWLFSRTTKVIQSLWVASGTPQISGNVKDTLIMEMARVKRV